MKRSMIKYKHIWVYFSFYFIFKFLHSCLWPFRFVDFRFVAVPAWDRSGLWPWASYQIRKIAGCACAGNAGNISPRRRFQRKPLVSDPGMHHGSDACRDRSPAVTGKMFPAFPAHAHPQFYVFGKRPIESWHSALEQRTPRKADKTITHFICNTKMNIKQTSTELMTWISNYIDGYLSYIITHPYSKPNVNLDKLFVFNHGVDKLLNLQKAAFIHQSCPNLI